MKKFRLRITGDLGFEVWADIPGYEGLYQVSTYGRVRSLDHYGYFGARTVLYKGKIVKPAVGTDGYYHVYLQNGKGNRKPISIHRIVAQVFLSNPYGKREVNHKDENKLNNRVENLEWLTSKENANYGTRNTRAINTKKERGLLKKVSMLDLDGNFLRDFDSTADAARWVGGKHSNICSCCNNKAKTAYGFKWQFE